MAYESVDVDPGTGASKIPVTVDTLPDGTRAQVVKLNAGGDGLSEPITAITPADATANQAALPVAGLMMGRTAAAGTWESLRVSNTTSDAMVGHAAGVLDVQAHNTVYNGTTWDRLRGDTTNGVDVDVTRLPALVAGTANIGDVDVLTQPARAATTDNIGAKLATDAIMNGTTALTPKFAIIDAATSGDNTLIAAVASKKIRVLALMMVAAGTVTARFESGAAGTALSGQMNLVANSGFTLPFNPVGWFETAANTLLNLELSAAISVDGMLTYVEV